MSSVQHQPPPPSLALPPFHHKRETEREQILLNPFRAPSALYFVKAFTIWNIWPSVTFFTAWATLIILLHRNVTSLQLSPTILTVLGTVIGFVVSYRTSSAYERYNDGRKQWSSIILGGRSLARLIWLHVPDAPRQYDPNNLPTEEERLRSIIEKKTIINLIEGFAVSLKHYLRGEHGIYYEDLYHLACFLPKYAFPSGHPLERPDLGFTTAHCVQTSPVTNECAEKSNVNVDQNAGTETPQTDLTMLEGGHKEKVRIPNGEQQNRPMKRKGTAPLNPFKPDHDLLPAYNPPDERWVDRFPILAIFRALWKGTRNVAGLRRRKGVYARVIHDDNIPLEIIWYIDSYIAQLQRLKALDVPTTNALLAGVQLLTDSLTTLERILTTPIPFGYIVHLKLVIWGYLLFLPFQLVTSFGFITIPATALVGIAFLGFLRVGEEIENPFGYDLNDLDMDHFCHHLIAPELAEITAWAPPDPSDFIFSTSNIPLLDTRDYRSGYEFLNSGLSAEDVQELLRTRHSRGGHPSGSCISPV
ncbi:Bestrophin, RFP-TM, chloride channel-domain-containing protein [Melampsora americana]|nr:Bestrophin, RFP-TM, chloride channel-domain-containing protein [Melampsora americana]